MLTDQGLAADLAGGAELAGAAEVELEGGDGGAASGALLVPGTAHVSVLLLLLLCSVRMRAAVADVAEAEALQLADQVGVVLRAVHAHLAAHRRAC